MLFSAIAVSFAATSIVAQAATSTGRSHVLHEQRDHLLAPWLKRGDVSSDAVLPMRIGLTQRNLNKADDLLMDISHPSSKNYGKHYTADEVVELFAPSNESVEAIIDWLESEGIDKSYISQSVNKQWIQFDSSVEQMERVLRTKYSYYEHSTSGEHFLGCDQYQIPTDMQAHIDYITPGVKGVGVRSPVSTRSQKKSRKARHAIHVGDAEASNLATREDLSKCGSSMTPDCYMALYNISAATEAHPGNNLGIFQSGTNVDQKDLNLYFTKFAPRIPNGTFPIIHSIDGGVNENHVKDASTEILDVEVSYPLIWPQNSVLFPTDDNYYALRAGSTSNPGFFNTFLDALDGSYCNYTAFGETGNSPIDPQYPDHHRGGYNGSLQCGVFKPTNVISLSYAVTESGGGLPSNYEQRQCSEYMKLGLQGISIVFASGDEGVAAAAVCGPGEGLASQPSSVPCNNGCLGSKDNIFSPYFPVTCPYVTAVGSTRLLKGGSAKAGTEVASAISGGGFSNVFARPSYQDAAVKGFFKSSSAPKYPYYSGSSYDNGLYNRTGRGVPDVSAVGTNVPIYIEGDVEKFLGTSISTPVFAAILTRINAERLKAGKSTIGFVNPTLYANPHAMHDITSGHNPGCNQDGFEAAVGWDPVTGLGSPNYPALLEVFMGLP